MSNKKKKLPGYKNGGGLQKKLLKNYTRTENVDLGPASAYTDSVQGEYGVHNVENAGITEKSLTNKKEVAKDLAITGGLAASAMVLSPLAVPLAMAGLSPSKIAGYDAKTKLGKNIQAGENVVSALQGIGGNAAVTSMTGVNPNGLIDLNKLLNKKNKKNPSDNPGAITGQEEEQLGMDSVSPLVYSALGNTVNAGSNESIDGTLSNALDPLEDNTMGKKEGGLMGKVNTQYRAQGGPIKGKGDGKSDSIKGKLNGGDFIVPVENAGIAENLRAKYFGKNIPVKMNNGGEANVALSDGEHLFTNDEKNYLMEQGVDISVLAPNANIDDNQLQSGGLVKKLADGGEVGQQMNRYKKQIADAEREGNEKAILYYERELRALVQAQKMRETEETKGNKWSEEKTLKVADAYASTYKKSFNEKQGVRNELKKQESLVTKIPEKLVNEIPVTSKSALAKVAENKSINLANDPYASTVPKNPNAANENKETVQDRTYVAIKQKQKSGQALSADEAKYITKYEQQKGVVGKSKTSIPAVKSPVSKQASVAVPTGLASTIAATKANDDAYIKSPGISEIANEDPGLPSIAAKALAKEKPKVDDGYSINAADIGAAAQFGLGLAGSLKDGKRPVYETNPLLNETVNRAFTDQFTGINPIDRDIMRHDLKVGLATSLENMYGSGISGGAAYANTRNAVAGYGEGVAKMASLDQQVKAQNKSRFDGLLGASLGEDKYRFETNKMTPWLQNQEAGAQLMNAGLSNFISNQLFKNSQDITREYADATNMGSFYKKTGNKLKFGF